MLLHVAFGDHQVANVATEVEARTIGAHSHRPVLDPGRSLRRDPFFGIPPIPRYPFDGLGARRVGQRPAAAGPLNPGDARDAAGPGDQPAAAVGQDPHELPRRTPWGRQQKSDFFQPGGRVTEVCGGGPCFSGGWSGRSGGSAGHADAVVREREGGLGQALPRTGDRAPHAVVARELQRVRPLSSKGGAAFVGAVRTRRARSTAARRRPVARAVRGHVDEAVPGAQQHQQQPVWPPGGDVEQDVGHVAEAGPLAVVGAGAEERGQQACGLHRPSGFGAPPRGSCRRQSSVLPRAALEAAFRRLATLGRPVLRNPRIPLLGALACLTLLAITGLMAYFSPVAHVRDAAALQGFTALNRPRLTPWLNDVAHLANPLPYALIGLGLAGIAAARGRGRVAVAILVLLVRQRRDDRGLKQLLAHPRHADWLAGNQISAASWPSGHATAR